MNLIMTCCFYSPLLPQALPIALFASIFGYWTTKYHLLRRCKMPDMFSDLMATFFGNLMPWLVLSWSMSTYFFFIRLRESTMGSANITESLTIRFETVSLGSTAMVITIIYLLCPIRTCIK